MFLPRCEFSNKPSYKPIPSNLHDIIIGLSLGDLHISRDYQNTRLRFKQGAINSSYLVHLYELFYDYCLTPPKFLNYYDKRKDKTYYSVHFSTRSLPIFNHYNQLFYCNKKKIIPLNIGDLLSPIGLAYWAMDDGS